MISCMADSAADIYPRLMVAFNRFLAEQLKLLLETKHLYQKLVLDPKPIVHKYRDMVWGLVGERDAFENTFNRDFSGHLTLADKQLLNDRGKPIPSLIVGNVKLFCGTCDAREAFRPIWFSDITNSLLQENLQEDKFKVAFRNNFQLFFLVYQCQHCEGVPEAFVVRRSSLDLSIEGRSPIEHVEIPHYIPKPEKHWFRDAVIAFQTGKVLAALFYLRTFIEQFARRKTTLQQAKATGDEIMTAYIETLPAHLRSTMPSLTEWYDKISASLHTANEDSELFAAARERIEKHFDIRRVHEIDKVSDPARTEEQEGTR